jgi:DNA repair protein RadC
MQEIIKEALKVMESGFYEGKDKLSSSEAVKNYCRLKLGAEKDEIFSIILLDNNLNLLAFEKMFYGTVNECNVYPRAIVRKVLDSNAAHIILTHNHPSGNTNPSAEDIKITKLLSGILNHLSCKLIDHIIVSPNDAISFTEKGIDLI